MNKDVITKKEFETRVDKTVKALAGTMSNLDFQTDAESSVAALTVMIAYIFDELGRHKHDGKIAELISNMLRTLKPFCGENVVLREERIVQANDTVN